LPGGCPAEEAAVLAAVADLGYPVESINILSGGFPCGVPFPALPYAAPAPACPPDPEHGPTAYVSFVGTEKVAALTFAYHADASLVANVVAFQVPPSGPAPA
jgi:hypothetical protein